MENVKTKKIFNFKIYYIFIYIFEKLIKHFYIEINLNT